MVSIEDYTKVDSGKATIAEFTAYLQKAEMRIRKCKLLKLKNGNFKVVMPSYVDNPMGQFGSNGNPSFKPYVEFSQIRQQELEKNILSLLKDTGYLKENSSSDCPF